MKGVLIIIGLCVLVLLTASKPLLRSAKYTYGFKLYDSIREIKGSNIRFKVEYDNQKIYYNY